MAYKVNTYKYNSSLSKEQNILCERLCALRMSKMSEALAGQFLDPNAELRTFTERVTDVINAEVDFRDGKKFNRLIRNAHLRYPAADFDPSLFDPERKLDTTTIGRLEDSHYIDEKKNLCICGASGAGKTYLACAFGVAACHSFRTVRYYNSSRLINELKRAASQEPEVYLAFLDELASYDLLILDDFGLMSLNLDDCRFLFELLEQRETMKSTMIVSEYSIKQWYDLFGRKTYADACLRRMTGDAYRIEMNGKDMSTEKTSMEAK